MRTFVVRIEKTVTLCGSLFVKARDESEARKAAMDLIREDDISFDQEEDESAVEITDCYRR